MEESSENVNSYGKSNVTIKYVKKDSDTDKTTRIVIDNQDFLLNLSDEIAIDILKYLDIKDLKNTSLVSKKWSSLSKDLNLWERLFNQFTQGFLWQFLFKNPDLTTYHNYFHEVFNFNFNYESFGDFITQLAEKFISEHEGMDKARLKVRKNYFKDLQGNKIKDELAQILELIKKIPKETRDVCLDTFQKKSDLSIENYHQVLPVLIKTAKLDSLLTDLIYMARYCYFPKRYIDWFFEKTNVMLSAEAIVALSAYSNSLILQTILQAPKLSHLRNKFTQATLVQYATIDGDAPVTILKHRTAINLLSDNDLIIFLDKLKYQEKDFYQLLDQNPSLLARMNSVFLVKLVNEVENYSSLILTCPKLLELLSDDEVIKISSKCSYRLEQVLENETFAAFLEKKPKTFLIQMPGLDKLIKNDRIAKCLDPLAVFQKAKGVKLRIGLALVEQNIILKQFSQEQLFSLALEHPKIALIMLNNQNLKDRWSIDALDLILTKTKNNKHYDGICQLIQSLKQYIHQKPKEYSQTGLQYSQPISPFRNTRNDLITNYDKESYTHHKLRKQKHSFPVPSSRDSTVKKSKNISFFQWKILLGVGLILLGLTSIALTATGIGALLNVPLAVGLLIAINVCHISMETLALGSLILGSCTGAIAGITSICLLCSQSIKNFLTPIIKESASNTRPHNTYSQLMKKTCKKSNHVIKNDAQTSTHRSDTYNFLFKLRNTTASPSNKLNLRSKEIHIRTERRNSM